MTARLQTLAQHLDGLSAAQCVTLATLGVVVVGGADYLTGYEVSMSVFYLGPVALAAWYAGRTAGIAIAVLSCVSWFVADSATGHPYSNSAIPVWNGLVRLCFLSVTVLLLIALRESLRAQRFLASTDALTGLYSRRVFDDRLAHDLALAQRHGSALTLAYVDVDDFRLANERLGHVGGDRVLRTIARVFSASLRESDTAARLGGDEFALILPATDADGARQIVTRLEQELREALAEMHLAVTCSVGVVTLLDPAIALDDAIAAADATMYEVKQSGKAAVRFRVLGRPVRPLVAFDAPQTVQR